MALQSLPKDFIIPASCTLTNSFKAIGKAIGNGVPYLAGRGLAITVLNFIASLVPNVKLKLDGEINGAKPHQIFKAVSKAELLLVLEPEEYGFNKN